MNSSSDSSIHDFNHWLFIRTTGDIWIGDRQLSQLKPKQLQQMRSQVGMVFQKFHLVGSLSAFHNVLHGALGRSNSPRYWFPATAPENERIKAMECLERVNLVHVAQQRVDGVYSFSRGFITLLRVILDLVWGLLFIVVVGLGVGAGILAITVDVMGFCGKF
ncbi:MAG: ATP-binding cassette domain-containing protein, partial [Cyanobacteria bacterium P01_C01_bin.72]